MKCLKSYQGRIETVYEGEKIIEDFSEKGREEFVSSFNTEQFKKIQTFFETMI